MTYLCTYVGGISVSGDASVNLLPGIYYLQGGGFSATDHAAITGTGVLHSAWNEGRGNIARGPRLCAHHATITGGLGPG
jgi:hypothetical protein